MPDAPPEGHVVRVFEPGDPWVAAAAVAIRTALAGTTAPRLVLAGGKTPAPVYASLVGDRGALPAVPWARVRFTWSDERMVPPEAPESNYGMARRTLLDPLGVSGDHVLRIRGEDPPDRAAEKLQRGLVVWSQRVPLFDLVLLGLGEDGHVASLFPADTWPDTGTRLAAATRHPNGEERVTLTPAALRDTRSTLFLVTGPAKAPALARALEAAEPSPATPSRMAVGRAGAVWLLDSEAAAELPASWQAAAGG